MRSRVPGHRALQLSASVGQSGRRDCIWEKRSERASPIGIRLARVKDETRWKDLRRRRCLLAWLERR